MKKCLITFRSVTPAQRGELFLRRAGIDCRLKRTNRWLEEQGCGYSLHLDCMDLPRALELLRGNGIAYKKVYRIQENGQIGEMNP